MSDALFIKRLRPVTKIISAGYTRPADTTAYAVGDVVADSTSAATILTFAGVARAAGLGAILQGAILIDSSAQSTKPDFYLYLFDTPPTMQNDNAQWSPSDAEMEACLGVVTLAGSQFIGSTAALNGIISIEGIAKAIQCASTDTNLYGILVARSAYTPTNAEKFRIRLQVIQD